MRNRGLWILLSASLAVAIAAAQENVIIRRHVQNVPGGGGVPHAAPPMNVMYGPTFEFVAAEIGFGGQVVKGKPYSAEAVTETNQMLADGNRIHRTMKSNIYRDSEGRTRREQTFSVIGHLSAADAPLQTIIIDDPVAGVHYILDTRNKTARKMTLAPRAHPQSASQSSAEAARGQAGERVETVVIKRQMEIAPQPAAGIPVAGPGIGVPRMDVIASTGPQQSESLGKQTIEGLEAEGTRTSFTIPAGQIGNERPIEVVSERWFSPQLNVVVLDRHNDPRMGETVYKLTNVQLADPAGTLFEVPPDYKIVEGREALIRHITPPETK
ncbi:MAG: hypothetical protein IT158_25620 [Bryobacterales bacterium]|nr:hypothetical protein [Bryobacterales bacterium]